MSWYRKHRPKTIAELDIAEIRESFQSMLASAGLPQVMLFAGPRGTGKTSTARIIGAIVNDPSNESVVDQLFFQKSKSGKAGKLSEADAKSDFAKQVFAGHSFVVQEMDAASNRGIDDIRALQERVNLPPAMAKMSVYILDEAHMLTTEAFNALLKLLEEPPPHAIFILATTELHKIPPTILSRCTLFKFRQANKREIKRALLRVLKAEKIKSQTADLDVIIERADGSFRDAVKLLELACVDGQLLKENLDKLVGHSAEKVISDLMTAVLAKNETQICQLMAELRQNNFDQNHFYKALFSFLHRSLMQNFKLEPGSAFTSLEIGRYLLNYLLKADLYAESPIPFLTLEIALLTLISKSKQKIGKSSSSAPRQAQTKSKPAAKITVQSAAKPEPAAKPAVQPAVKPTVKSIAAPDKGNQQDKDSQRDKDSQKAADLSKLIFDKWSDFLQTVSQKNSTLAALLRSSKPGSGSNGKASINVYYKFHQEQLQQPKFLSIIEACGEMIAGERVRFEFVLQKSPKKAELVELSMKENLVQLAEEALM